MHSGCFFSPESLSVSTRYIYNDNPPRIYLFHAFFAIIKYTHDISFSFEELSMYGRMS